MGVKNTFSLSCGSLLTHRNGFYCKYVTVLKDPQVNFLLYEFCSNRALSSYMGNKKLKAARKSGKITEAEYVAKVRAKAEKRKSKGGKKEAGAQPVPKVKNNSGGAQTKSRSQIPPKRKGNNAPKLAGKSANFGSFTTADQINSKKYLMCLIDPGGEQGGGAARIPTAEARKTGLWCSVQVVEVFASFTGGWATPDAGRWTCALQPIIGSPSAPSQYKISLADGRLPSWPTDWTLPASYVGLVDGFDIRVDPYTTNMTQQPAGFVEFLGSALTATDALPFGATPIVNTMYGFEPTYAAGSDNGLIVLPPGNYCVSVVFEGGTLPYVGNIDVYSVNDSQVGLVNTEFSAGVCVAQFLCYIQGPNSGFSMFTSSGGGINMGSIMYITRAFNEPMVDKGGLAMVPNISQGPVAGVRPVAMAALFTAEAPTSYVGGACVGAYVASSTCEQNFFNNVLVDQVGQLQNWGSLAKVPEQLDSKYQTGLYAYWVPEDVSNLAFLTPNVMNTSSFPCLIFSGQANIVGAAAPTAPVLIGRLKVWSVFEFTSLQTLYDMELILGCTQDYENAWRFLRSRVKIMKNDEHSAFKARIFAALKQAGWAAAKFVGTKALQMGLEALAV